MPTETTPSPQGPEKTYRIAGYEVIERLGEGAMGVVFKAKQISLGRTVALKVLAPRLTQDERFVERFLREARATAQLSHPNIVRIYEVDRSKGGIHYYAMECVDGPSVGSILKKKGRFPVKEACRIAAQVARALAHAHTQGLVHRDVKPDNILLASDGNAKLADLGLAHVQQAPSESGAAGATAAGHIVGTPYYMSPEQADGKSVDARSDLYSLGATLYHFVTGAPPFVAPTAIGVITKHLTEERPDPRRSNPEVSAGLANVIRKMLEIDPARRHPSALEAAEDLEAIARGAKPPHAAGTGNAKTSAGTGKTAAWIGISVFAIAAAGLGWRAVKASQREKNADRALEMVLNEPRVEPGRAPERQRAAYRDRLAALASVADRFSGTKAAERAAVERREKADAWVAFEQLESLRAADLLVKDIEQGKTFLPAAAREVGNSLAALDAIAADPLAGEDARRRAGDLARAGRARIDQTVLDAIEKERGGFARRHLPARRVEPAAARAVLDLLPKDGAGRAMLSSWLERRPQGPNR